VSSFRIEPQTVLLTAGQAVTFSARNDKGDLVAVNWSINPDIGKLAIPGTSASTATGTNTPAAASSATYIAPALGTTSQTIAIIATSGTDAASATISLTPEAIVVVPAKVNLKAQDQQEFTAIVAGPLPEDIAWTLSPPVGKLGTSPSSANYTAPDLVKDDVIVNVTATSRTYGKQATATITLCAPPWQGSGANLLGAFLLLVFSVIFLMVVLWPPALPSPETARADRIDAESNLRTAKERQAVAQQKAALAKPAEKTAPANNQPAPGSTSQNQKPTTGSSATTGDTVTATAANAGDEMSDLVKQVFTASDDLEHKRKVEKEVNDTYVNTKLGRINRELDLIWLVMLAGALGSFLHTAQSYSDYVGNQKLKASWVWWYCYRPFIGAGLAFVFYAAVRGGVMAIASGSTAKAAELNPFGVISVAAMVGMFSKAATMKLGEVFDTLFKTDSAKQSKDKLAGSAQTTTQTATKPAADNTSAETK